MQGVDMANLAAAISHFLNCYLGSYAMPHTQVAVEEMVGIFIRALPNRGSLLFGRKRNRIRVVALKFEAMSLSLIIVNVNIVILDIHSRSASSVYQYESKIHVYSQSR